MQVWCVNKSRFKRNCTADCCKKDLRSNRTSSGVSNSSYNMSSWSPWIETQTDDGNLVGSTHIVTRNLQTFAGEFEMK